MHIEMSPACEKPVCFLCSRDAEECCNLCGNEVWFCSPAHRRMHREDDQPCRPFSIAYKEGVGRCITASRKINAGEIIFIEEALVVGPSPQSSMQCLTCRKKIVTPVNCAGCSFPMCSSDCCSIHLSLSECPVIARLQGEDRTCHYELLLPLRLLLLNDPHARAVAANFMTHEVERKEDEEHWRRILTDVIEPLAKAASNFSIEEVCHAVGVVEVNNYEIYNPSDCGFRGVYPLTSLLSHSCVPNSRPSMSRQGPLCPNRCVAAVDIDIGEEVTTSYVHLHLPNSLRRKRLHENWYFDCNCSRCRDPTECGTFLDGIKCKDCVSGCLLPNNQKEWRCLGCGGRKVASEATSLVEELLATKESLRREDIEGHLRFHDECCGSLLHENHYLMNAVRRWVLPLYCRTTRLSGAAGEVVTDEMLEKKVWMCKKYLFILDRVERGFTKNRGRILYELADATLTLQNRKYQSRTLSEEKMREELCRCEQLAHEAVLCLAVDDEEGTFEKYVKDACVSLENNARQFLEFLERP